MAETAIKIEIFRKKTLEEFSLLLSDPNSRLESGSGSAAVGAFAGSLLLRAANLISESDERKEELEWYVRNAEILRSYLINLVDEDVKCRAPLIRAEKKGDEQRIEASRQTSVSICLEIINMMGKCLEMASALLLYADEQAASYLRESAEFAYAAALSASEFVLTTSALSTDDTYRYVIKRENELTMQEQKELLDRILSGLKSGN